MIDEKWIVSGLLPDKRDKRDYIIKTPRGRNARRVLQSETSADLRQFAREIENQGSVGSCVGNATSSCLELYAKSKLSLDKNFSRLFIYWNARDLGNINGDEGAYLRDGIKSCNKWGICEEEHWEYIENKVNNKPDNDAYNEARKNRAITYERIENDNLNVFKSTLLQGMSIIIGMGLSSAFYNISGPINSQNYEGITADDEFIGGHALNIVGFDDNLNGGSFIVENSWGTSWGDNGYFAMTYDVWERDGYDAWTCSLLKVNMASSDNDYVPGDDSPHEDQEDANIKKDIENISQEAHSFFSGKIKYIRSTSSNIRQKSRDLGLYARIDSLNKLRKQVSDDTIAKSKKNKLNIPLKDILKKF